MRRIPLFLVIVIFEVLLPIIALADSVSVKIIDFNVEVQESIIVDANTIDVTLFPGETTEKTIQIKNVSNVDVNIIIDTVVSGGNGLNVEIDARDGRVRVPGGATVHVGVLISAANDASTGKATVHINIQRE